MPTSREEFTDYCLRSLGAPVIQINVAPSQVEDRVDEAIRFWQDFHYDGSTMIYLKHTITEEDVTRGWIVVPDHILGITRIIDSTHLSTSNPLDFEFQFIASQIANISNVKMSDYYMARQHLALIQDVLVGRPTIRYNRHDNKVFIDNSIFHANRTVVFEAWDPTMVAAMWNDRWLQNYAIALIGRQWGRNLTKFQNVQLMSGVSFNGDQLLQIHEEERKRLEEEVMGFGPGLGYYMG